MSTGTKDDDVIEIDSSQEDFFAAEEDNDKDKPSRSGLKRTLRQSTIDETLLGRGRTDSPLAKKPAKSTPSITVKKTVVSKEDMRRLSADKTTRVYGPVVMEAPSCSGDEARKMHERLLEVNANRVTSRKRPMAESNSPVKVDLAKRARSVVSSLIGWVRQSSQKEKTPSDKGTSEPVDSSDTHPAASQKRSSASGSRQNKESAKADMCAIWIDLDSASSETADLDSMGAAVESLLRTPQCSAQLSDLKSVDEHTVLVMVNSVGSGGPPRPFPSTTADPTYGWLVSGRYVRMPCSSKNLFPSADSTDIVDRWPMIQTALIGSDSWKTSYDIEKAIVSFNGRSKNFDTLHRFFSQHIDKDTAARYMTTLVPAMARLALRLPELITQPLPLLRQGKLSSVTMSQEQAACILANAFFCTFPGRNMSSSILPSINFNSLYRGGSDRRGLQKLHCIFHYFDRVLESMPCGLLTFYRRARDVFPDWAGSQKLLRRLHISARGTIEDDGRGMLQMDFANKYIGGGVLDHGCVQEEIRFLVCPELIVGCLLTELLRDNECLVMKGAERFSTYSGYAGSFTWTDDYRDDVPSFNLIGRLSSFPWEHAERLAAAVFQWKRPKSTNEIETANSWMRRETEIVGVDAVPFVFDRFARQFTSESIARELNKAFVGFYGDGQPAEHLSAIATGNWGCGAFGGDKELKSLLQLMAAAEADRDMAYFTFGDRVLVQKLHRVHSELVAAKCDVGRLHGLIIKYADVESRQTAYPSLSLFEFLLQTLADGNDGDHVN